MKNRLTLFIFLPLLFAGCDWDEIPPAEMASLNQSQTLHNEKSLNADVRVDVGTLEISGESSTNVFTTDLEYDKVTCEPTVHYDSSHAGDEGRLSVRLESAHRGRMRGPGTTNRLRLKLANSIPLKLNVDTGVGEARLSLSGLKLTGLDFESGVGGAKISVFEANSSQCESIRIKNGVGGLDALGLGNLNFRELEFEGGVGGAKLDFTGQWKQDADIRVQIGVGGVAVSMPRNVGVRVEAEKHLFGGLHLDGFTKRDFYYYSNNYDQTKVHLNVRVTTGVGGFSINWV